MDLYVLKSLVEWGCMRCMEKNSEGYTPGWNHSLYIGSLLFVYLFTRMKTSRGTEGKGEVKGEVREPKYSLLSCVQLFFSPWTTARQAPPSMGFPRQEYWSGFPFPSLGDLPDPGIKPRSPALQADSLPSEPPGKPKEAKRRKRNYPK